MSLNGNIFRVTGPLWIHRSPVNSPHKGQWRGDLMFSLICAWTNGWVNDRDAGDLRHHRAHYDVTVMTNNLPFVSSVTIVGDEARHCTQSLAFLFNTPRPSHYCDVIMSEIASQITSLTIVYSIVYPVADQRKHQSYASLAFVRGIHRRPVNSPHKGPVTRKIFPFDDVIMTGTTILIPCL